MKNKIINIIILTTSFLLTAMPLLAQPPSLPPTSAPIDGGLSLLAAAGIGYGVKKMREKRNKNEK